MLFTDVYSHRLVATTVCVERKYEISVPIDVNPRIFCPFFNNLDPKYSAFPHN